MNLKDIAAIRLISQQIEGTAFKTAKDIVHWMGAMQAQDYNMAKWAIGLRLPGLTDKLLEGAIDKGEIIRTHLLRPTWHFVSAEAIYWMLELTAPQIKTAQKTRLKQLEITDEIINKSHGLLEKALEGGQHLTREELRTKFEKAKIATGENRLSHLLLRAELDGIVCSGAIKDKKQTYALLAERVPKAKALHKEEALAKLAQGYFLSHCPATLQDFIWWSGLSSTSARHALEMVKPNFNAATIGTQTYWLSPSFSEVNINSKSLYLLPAFDEFIISYRDRSASLPFENHKKTISNNGIFRPAIVLNGQVVGIWKRTTQKENVVLELQFFLQLSTETKDLIEKAVQAFGHFLDTKAIVVEATK